MCQLVDRGADQFLSVSGISLCHPLYSLMIRLRSNTRSSRRTEISVASLGNRAPLRLGDVRFVQRPEVLDQDSHEVAHLDPVLVVHEYGR